MGMFSEIHAAGSCKEYEQILLAAIASNDRNILCFCRENIYPKYILQLGEAFIDQNEIIKHTFITNWPENG